VILDSKNVQNQAYHTNNKTISLKVDKKLELATIVKACQSLSSEIELDKLLSTLLLVMMKNASADKSALVLSKNGQWMIEAISQLGETPILIESTPLEMGKNLPVSVINTVKNTLEAIVVEDATSDQLLAADPYIFREKPQSILCSPLLKQGKIIGILYLENSLIPGVFTSERIELINLLCTQAAIVLENAKLYQASQQIEAELREQTQELQKALQTQQRMTENLKLQREASFDGILIIDENRRIVFYNKFFTEIFQLPDEVIHAFDDQRFLDYAATQAENPTDFLAKVEYLYQNPDLTSHDEIILKQGRTLERRSMGVRTTYVANGKNYGRIWYFRDISDHKQTEALLKKQAQELLQAFQELQETQVQLIQSEKMSALGNLVAGIAHEINNPVSFLSGNIQPALEYIQDIFALLNLYQQKYPNPDSEIQDQIEEMDLDFIRTDLPNLINSMHEGVRRIQGISNSLRTFSRADCDYPVAYDIHDGIENTLLILKHRLKANEYRPEIQVMSEYGQLPEVKCFAGQLNQVFMNILANAIDALEESNAKRSFANIAQNPNRISITATSNDLEQVIINIKDNGQGMTQEVKEHIFEHLYTTKGVGKGTGLGLAIAHQIIVEKHGGTIDVKTSLGEGTEFTIIIPTQVSASNK
jgi:signal transduction histidine kinase/GAF domain-containing protein